MNDDQIDYLFSLPEEVQEWLKPFQVNTTNT
jgi:hypothetical protein